MACSKGLGVGGRAGKRRGQLPPTPQRVGDLPCPGTHGFWSLSPRNLIVNLGLFAAGVWLARNLSDIDLMAPQPAA
uniref:Translocase of outer mitochondrial membrane 6 n=1 Tax=Ornithorhynchus anatinus TaxID=9258 RepID=A0A6I8NVG5_ORNAN